MSESSDSKSLLRQLAEVTAECAELNATFDLQHQADMRAIKLWQEAHPERKSIWPDRCNMVVWLMEQLDANQSELVALKAIAADLAAKTLADRMSEISEERWCASWLHGLEDLLFREMVDGKHKDLQQLYELAGCWIVWDNVSFRRRVPRAEWEAKTC